MFDWIAENLGYDLKLNPIDLSGISGMADILMVLINILLLITVWQGIRNIRETKKSRDAEMMTLVLGQIEEIKPSIKDLNRFGCYDNWKNNKVALNHAQIISTRLQRLSYLGEHGLINRKHLIEMWGPIFVTEWGRLQDFVKDIRKKNNEPTDLDAGAFSRKDFERFAYKCSRYLTKHYPLMADKFHIQ